VEAFHNVSTRPEEHRGEALLERYDKFVVDLDGCVWLGEQPIAGSAQAIACMRDAGKQVVFATNDSRCAGEAYATKLRSMAIEARASDVVSAGGTLQEILAAHHRGARAFVIGTEAMLERVSAAGLAIVNGSPRATRAKVVVVAGSEQVVYDDLRCAALSVRAGAVFLAAARDATLPHPDGLWPGTGAILAAVECASGRRAQVIGKPEPALLESALRLLGAGRTLMIGDRLDSDVVAAARAGLDAALVLTGSTTLEEARRARDPVPVVIVESLAALAGVELRSPT
jgi:HAD superfamily hydrolase (TIGR01450 family)